MKFINESILRPHLCSFRAPSHAGVLLLDSYADIRLRLQLPKMIYSKVHTNAKFGSLTMLFFMIALRVRSYWTVHDTLPKQVFFNCLVTRSFDIVVRYFSNKYVFYTPFR